MKEDYFMNSCLREPISEIFEAARLLDAAVTLHIQGKSSLAEELIKAADLPEIREWTESLWGKGSPYVTFREVHNTPPKLPKADRIAVRMPGTKEKQALHIRDGFHCRFCKIPVIRKEVRQIFHDLYPNALQWGRKNLEQHAAFQAMWLQYDHVIPHARGGNNNINNVIITCAPCNFARMDFLVEEVGVEMPNLTTKPTSSWDGLERLLKFI